MNAINRSFGSAVQCAAAGGAVTEIQHERSDLDFKEGQWGLNVNGKRIKFHLIKGCYLLSK